jgi:hypothetical protein
LDPQDSLWNLVSAVVGTKAPAVAPAQARPNFQLAAADATAATQAAIKLPSTAIWESGPSLFLSKKRWPCLFVSSAGFETKLKLFFCFQNEWFLFSKFTFILNPRHNPSSHMFGTFDWNI